MKVRVKALIYQMSLLLCIATAWNFFLVHPSVVTAAPVTRCGQFDTWNVTPSSKEFVVMNNRWNANTSQCITGDDTNSAWSVSTSAHNLPLNGPPAGYPAIYSGCHYGNCTQNSSMPRQINTIQAIPSTWSVQVPANGAWNVAYDLWLNQTSTTNGQNNGAEVMVWLNSQGVNPAGTKVATVKIECTTWDVWYTQLSGSGVSWNYVAYKRVTPITNATLNLKSFLNDAQRRGYVRSNWWLTSVQAGFELWQWGVGIMTKFFKVAVW